jgi:predicted O-methyltransferase YrrM
VQDLTLDFVCELYLRHADDLRTARDEQRALLRASGMVAQLDDVEAEISYLLLRAYRPALVVEIGSLHGWSTSWQLRALRDNGVGRLRSYDLVAHARRAVPAELAEGRWTFVPGDVRRTLDVDPTEVDQLFLDAAHSARFARWYLGELVPRLNPGTPVSVHDVFHHRWAVPLREGAVLLRWLRTVNVPHLTASRARAPLAFERLARLRANLGLGNPVHTGRDNPMVWFTRP